MSSRSLVVGAFAALVALAACGRDDAGPTVIQDDAGVVQATVLTDVSNSSSFVYTARAGIAVGLYRDGDTLLLRRATTNAQGKVIFRGLPEGRYFVRPIVRPNTVFGGPEFTAVTVTRGRTDSSSVFRFRQGARLSGFLAAEFTTPTGPKQVRFGPGIIVELHRDTSVAQSGRYALIGTDTTDAASTFAFFATPQPQRYRLIYRAPQATLSDSLRFVPDTLQGVRNPEIIFTSGSGGLVADNVTQNLIFNYTSRIAGVVFKDLNNNRLRTANEALIPLDTAVITLRDSATGKVLATQRVTSATTALAAIGRPAQGYSFTSLEPGTYVILMDRISSRFLTNPAAFRNPEPIYVTVATNRDKRVIDYPIRSGP